jgi:hypothetical protein
MSAIASIEVSSSIYLSSRLKMGPGICARHAAIHALPKHLSGTTLACVRANTGYVLQVLQFWYDISRSASHIGVCARA